MTHRRAAVVAVELSNYVTYSTIMASMSYIHSTRKVVKHD